MVKRMVMGKKIVGVEESMQHVKQRLCNSHVQNQNSNKPFCVPKGEISKPREEVDHHGRN